ncbi:MAG: hypothetical protein DWG76_07470 [Chloroflexi bacterium]|nr:hypothetical protein [Chloroflexota bacterium]
MLDDIDLDLPEEEPKRPRPSSGRSFMVVAGVLGAIMLLALISMAIYALVILPRQQAAEPKQPSSVQQTTTALALAAAQDTSTNTSTSTASATATRTPTQTASPSPTEQATIAATDTPVTPIFTNTPGPTTAGETATVEAALTNAALAATNAASTGTLTPTSTPSALPDTGFADDVGASGLILASLVLLAVIVLTRQLRSAYE